MSKSRTSPEDDDGDLDDTVYYCNSSKRRAYHDDPNCRQLKHSDRDTLDCTRKEAQDRWLNPCAWCLDIVEIDTIDPLGFQRKMGLAPKKVEVSDD